MKKVVILTPSLGMGGMERVLVNYANLFVRSGYDVTVLNLTYHDEELIKSFDERVRYQSYYSPVKHLFKSSLKSILKGDFRLCSFTKWVKKHNAQYLYKKLIRDDFDVEIAFFGGITAKIVSGSTNLKAKGLVWIHSANIQGLIDDIGSEEVFRKVYNSIENVVCVSNEVKKRVLQLISEDRLTVVHNPHDVEKVRELASERVEMPKDRLNLINVSRLDDKSKGFIRLLDVCNRLNADGFNYNLWVVGDGPDAEKIKAYAKELKLDNVKFLGKQSNPYKYVSAADVYVCSSYYEGFSMTMMEAIILAKPILTTDVSGADEMLDGGKYGIIVENSAEGLYQGLKNLLSDTSNYEYYKRKAEERKEYFDSKKVMEEIEKLIL